MKKELNLSVFLPVGCEIEKRFGGTSILIKSQPQGGRIQTDGTPMLLGGADWQEAKYIVFDAINHEEWTMGVSLSFWTTSNSEEDPDMTITMGLIPGIKTRLALPIEALNSQKMFLPRTPGKLKTVVWGNKVDLKEVKRFAIGTIRCFAEQRLEIYNLQLTDEEPIYPLEEKKFVDNMGQQAGKSWLGKTESIDSLRVKLLKELDKPEQGQFMKEWSTYGGWKSKSF